MEEFKKPEIPSEKERLPKNVVVIDKPDGRFRIAYGAHHLEQKAEDIAGADGIVLETAIGGDYSTQELAEKVLTGAASRLQYRRVFESAAKYDRPIFLADVDPTAVASLLSLALSALEYFVAYKLLASLAKDASKTFSGEKTINRRGFIKLFGKGMTGLYLSISLAERLSLLVNSAADYNSKLRAVNRFFSSLNEKVHPETNAIVVTLRNHIIVQKLHTIAQRLKEGVNKKPEIALIFGAGHTGIENALEKDDKDRVEIIDRLLEFPGAGDMRRRLANIARFDFDKKSDKWKLTEIFKDPVLAPLESKG